MSTSPTPYPEVNAVLDVLLLDIQEILGDQFIGMYLYGSLAYGGFDQYSDVDFVVVTREELPELIISGLQAMHARIAKLDSCCAIQLEGTYIPQHALQQYDPVRALHVHIDRGPDEYLQRMQIDDPLLSRAWWGGWVLLRAALREKGIVIAGPPTKKLIDPVSPDDFRQATLAILEGWAAPLLEHPVELAKRGYQSYTVLTLCRMLYTLEYTAIVSKQVAAHWAQARLGEPCAALIERAWSGRHNPGALAAPQDLNGTLAFVRFTLEHSRTLKMKTDNSSPTPYPDINAILAKLLESVQVTLGYHFSGLYLHGSLASGDFNPQTSDIDFLVVTDGPLPVVTFSALQEMHARLFASGLAWTQKLEGAYIPKEDLRRHDPAHAPVPWLGVDGHFAHEKLGSDWILQRWILREKGILISGPPLTSLIDPVNADDLREAVRASLQEWWSPPFTSPQRFQSGEYQVYAILTMCRSLYVLEHGCVAPKPEAAHWAMEKFEESWHALIAAAAMWRPGMDFDQLEETMGLIRFTLQKWGLTASNQYGTTHPV